MQPRFPLEFIDAERDLAVINWDKCAKRPSLCGEPENPLGHLHDYVWSATGVFIGHCRWVLSEDHACRRCGRFPSACDLMTYTYFFIGVFACNYEVLADPIQRLPLKYFEIADPLADANAARELLLETVEVDVCTLQCPRCLVHALKPVKSKLL